ncbi:S-layer homology domain-containing protein [Coleofasciculus sp. FACHB-T130]|uniref:S-layer homology domain-containing protein n=1 Tax=Cyanophyceae TaxID=3028117 RepID=UPI0016841082|nr:S-layer homology domain-containing protein [Coleofasciculus sp. FACHB-T130]MBD1877585.1 S-layer homology domain-containing protein [Coleofasciculus sp. FACHB-T130]
MSKFFKTLLLYSPAVSGMALLLANSAVAQEAIPNNPNSQMPPPTERYGCLSGNGDGTFQGNRPVTRYEFAAGLNACLNQVEQLIDNPAGNRVTQEGLTVPRSQLETYRLELERLRNRVDKLDTQTREQSNQ